MDPLFQGADNDPAQSLLLDHYLGNCIIMVTVSLCVFECMYICLCIQCACVCIQMQACDHCSVVQFKIKLYTPFLLVLDRQYWTQNTV